MLIDITLANELPSLWVNLTKISHLVWRTCVKDPDTFPWLAHLYASQWIPIYILCRDCIDEINVFAAGSCGTERRHRTKIARDVKKADGRNCTLKWTLILPFRGASVTLSEVIASHSRSAFENQRRCGHMRQLALSGCQCVFPTFSAALYPHPKHTLFSGGNIV